MIRYLSLFLLLGVCSYEDFKRKQIRTACLALFAAEGILYCMFSGERTLVDIAAALLPGCCVLALSFFTHGEIGEGDGLLLITMGLFLEAFGVCMVFFYALFLAAVYALYLYNVRKKNRKYEIAFIPFVLAAYILYLYLESFR